MEKDQLADTELLRGIRVAILISDGFEQIEFDVPVWELKRNGARVDVLCLNEQQLHDGVQGMNRTEHARFVKANALLRDADPAVYDALYIPGGAIGVDSMRPSYFHLGFIRNFFFNEKPVATSGHGAWLLADAGVAANYTLACWPAIRKDLERAGAVVKDVPMIHDRNTLTCRGLGDVPAFSKKWVTELMKIPRGGAKAA